MYSFWATYSVRQSYMFYRWFIFFFFLANRPTSDQTADRRQVKSIPVLRTYVQHG